MRFERYAVGINPARQPSFNLKSGFGDGNDFVGSGGACVHCIELGYGEYAVHRANVLYRCNHAPALRIHDHNVTIAKMRDKEQMPAFIDALIIQPRRITGQCNVGNSPERRVCAKARSDAKGSEYGRRQ